MTERTFRFLSYTAIAFLIVVCLVDLAYGQESPEPLRPDRRVAPIKADPSCKYVQSPWGVPCSVPFEECSLHLMPMFPSGVPRQITVKLLTSKSIDDGDEATVPWDGGAKELTIRWDGAPLKWVEWYIRNADGDYGDVPAVGCYCNEPTGEVVRCILGIREEEVK